MRGKPSDTARKALSDALHRIESGVTTLHTAHGRRTAGGRQRSESSDAGALQMRNDMPDGTLIADDSV